MNDSYSIGEHLRSLGELRNYRRHLIIGLFPWVLMAFVAIVVHWGPALPPHRSEIATAILLGLACFFCSALVGFLFGIPKVAQRKGDDDSYQLTINTNLTDVSDWITKILVGIGLVQLTSISEKFNSLSTYLSGTGQNKAFIVGLILFSASFGFIYGYIATRIYLAEAFATADRAVLSGNVYERLKTIEESIAMHSRVEFLIDSASVFAAKKNFEAAHCLLEAALKLDKTNESAMLYQALIYKEVRDYISAEKSVDNLLAFNPESPEGLLAKGYYILLHYDDKKEILSETDENKIWECWKAAFIGLPKLRDLIEKDSEFKRLLKPYPKLVKNLERVFE